ncbi:endolytic transglycosylase MltG [Corynebacterium uropygiale]|uniref:Endolytic murein transglycosylase n=1 Tax=Corynebacterium uropygiale TaxID=1775911 RepID=A0A9X1QP47_9CORY|nr:endolytic transglycosylase MltG [Corynebacterium uropygiale]MCF4006551.1 endolytic transglycosylase MltG [Corynebacterium uropygiale]
MSKQHGRAPQRWRMEPKYVKRRQRGLAVLIAALVLIIFAVIYIGVKVTGGTSDYRGEGNGVVQLVEIKEGSSLSEMGSELEERGIVRSEEAFQQAAASSPEANNVQPGFYRLQERMSAKAAVHALTDPANLVEFLDIQGGSTLSDVTVVGGQNRPGIYSEISRISCAEKKEGGVTVEQLEKVASTTDPRELGVPEWAVDAVNSRGSDPRRLEGLIIPGRYLINPDMDAREILTDLITRSASKYEETGIEARAHEIGLSPYELIIAASLVEREAPAGDFDKVARVILNRLHKPMRLEFDSTVNYDLKEQEVATRDEDRERKTPWNTYAKEGLPETPIAAPSEDAITAMEHPAEGEWLFFVTVDKDGTTEFNNTFEEHQADTRRAIESGLLDSRREEHRE